jgi:hypothetical protein
MDINVIRQLIRNELPYRIDMAVVTGVDQRDSRHCSIRLSGGTSVRNVVSMADALRPGMEVVVLFRQGIERPVVIGAMKDSAAQSSSSSTNSITPPANVIARGYVKGVLVQWDFYPGNIGVCYQVQYNTAAQESGTTDILTTMGSYYLHSGAFGETWYFRVRSLVWLGDNNVGFSSWSEWVNAAVTNVDDRYYTETELGAITNPSGASRIGILDTGGLFTATTVEGALQEAGAGIAGFHSPLTLDADAATILDLVGQQLGLDAQVAGTVLAGPLSGASDEPTFKLTSNLGRWEPITNGDSVVPELLFDNNGDVLVEFIGG